MIVYVSTTSGIEVVVAGEIQWHGGCSHSKGAPAASDIQEAALAREFRRCQGEGCAPVSDVEAAVARER
jgi:hypothetical protein